MPDLETVFKLYHLGFSIIPLPPRSKAPPTLRTWAKYQTQSPPLRSVQTWWKDDPDRNVAVITGKISGVIVLDIDDESELEKVQELGLPETVCAKTNRGYHFYFNYPAFKVPSRAGGSKNWPFQHVDLQSEGKYVVAPPSVHPEGPTYEWERSPFDCEIADPPEWLLELLRPMSKTMEKEEPSPVTPKSARELLESALSRARIGNRNKTGFFELACPLRDEGISKDDAREAMLEYAKRVLSSPTNKYEERDALRSLESAYKRPPRAKIIPGSTAFLDKVKNMVMNDEELLESDGIILIAIADHNRATGENMCPSYIKLHFETGLGLSTIARRIRALEMNGRIEITKDNSAQRPGRYFHRYKILFPNETSESMNIEENANTPNNAGSITMNTIPRVNTIANHAISSKRGEMKNKRSRIDNKADSIQRIPDKSGPLIQGRLLISLKEATEMLGFGCYQTTMAYVHKQELKCVRLARNAVYFTHAQLQAFIASHIE